MRLGHIQGRSKSITTNTESNIDYINTTTMQNIHNNKNTTEVCSPVSVCYIFYYGCNTWLWDSRIQDYYSLVEYKGKGLGGAKCSNTHVHMAERIKEHVMYKHTIAARCLSKEDQIDGFLVLLCTQHVFDNLRGGMSKWDIHSM